MSSQKAIHARAELSRIIGEGVGEASTCWESLDNTGEFDSVRASEVITKISLAAVAYANSLDSSFQNKARTKVYEYVRSRLDITDGYISFGLDDVFVVWFCKTLQNWKCLISTTLPDGMYYEVTYDGDKEKTYLDAYKKWANIEISEGIDSEGPL